MAHTITPEIEHVTLEVIQDLRTRTTIPLAYISQQFFTVLITLPVSFLQDNVCACILHAFIIFDSHCLCMAIIIIVYYADLDVI